MTPHAWRALPHTMAARLSRGAYKLAPHLRIVSRAIAETVDAGGGLLIFEAPPRHGKSETVSRWTPVWHIAEYPDRHIVLASYGADLAAASGRFVRNTVAEHSGALGVQIADDSSASDRWHTNAGGSCRTVGIGGALTGFGAHLLVIDDPIKDAEEADSELMRDKVWEWFLSVAWTRREPGCVVIVMMTRWHEDDLVGRILAHTELSKLARVISFPAIAEADDVLGRKPGEALWEERHPRALLEQTQAILSSRWWLALYQQRPTSDEGNEIKRHWWRWYDELPVPRDGLEYVIASWDCAFKETEKSDFVVGQVWGVYGAYRYLLDVYRDRAGFVETAHAISAMAQKWNPNACPVELAANGDAIVESLQKYVSGIHGVEVRGKGSKIARARAVAPQIEAGQVWLPRGKKWADELVEECAAFPRGKNDDQVDAMSQALDQLRGFQAEPLSHLTPGDDRFVPPHILELQKRGVLGGLGTAPKFWRV